MTDADINLADTADGVATPWNGAPRGLYVLAMLGFLMAITFGLRSFGSLLSSFFLALVIVVAVSPVRSWAIRKGMPGWAATILFFVSAVSVIGVVVVGVLIAIQQFVSFVSHSDYTNSIADLQKSAEKWLEGVGLEGEQLDDVLKSIDLSSIAGRLAGLLSGAFGIVSLLATVIVTMVFLVMDSAKFDWLVNTQLSKQRPHLSGAMAGFAENTRRYFKVNTIFGAGVAVVNVLILWIFGIPLALVWGLLSFLSSFIPNVGFVIGLAPPALLALALDGPWTALAIIALYVIVNAISDNGLKPKFVGEAVGLSATLTFMSLLFWAWVFGALGALLAVPLTLFVKALLIDSDPKAQWMESLISLTAPDEVIDEPTPENPAADALYTDSPADDASEASVGDHVDSAAGDSSSNS